MGNNTVLNRFFTQYTIKDLLCQNKNKLYINIIKRYIDDTADKNNGDLISEIYSYMGKNYRNEYFYQNTLLNRLLLGKHSINTTTALTQIPINKSKADFILINGKAVVYEIKTELDSFERLKNQLTDYYKAFTHTCVVTCEDNYEYLNDMLADTPVGICILTKRNQLSFRKEPMVKCDDLDYKSMFKVLHKKEFEYVIETYFGKLPETTPVLYYEECYKWFCKIPKLDAYHLMLKELKKRNKITKEKFEIVPYELKSLMYFYSEYDNNYSELHDFLNEEYRR